ncbi:ATP-binding cassette, subfamily C, CydC [Modicisalibacter muralis]|uniref:ATP-binding cassette, subfamily C, CydC n=1 Tax=Modicisalibacter muralis TaxID=119000 RepID=A0A1G9G201_9GAMM|nr:thiol reductant ABC exporter subunit CydC [Halomonas muralis]SDK94649.1 ATP-binding cassette, subfamily C, CydC [Halomonas muralis]
MSRPTKTTLASEFRPWLRVLDWRRRRLWKGAGLMLLTVIAAIGLLALSGWFITATAIAGVLAAAGVAISLGVYIPGGGIRLFAVLRTGARYLERIYNHDTVLRLLADLRANLFAVLIRLDGRELARLRAAEWLNRLTADIDTLDGLYLRLLAPPLVALVAIVAVSALLGFFAPWVGGAVLLALLALWTWLVLGQSWLGMAPSQRRVATLDRLRMRAIEQLQGLAELRCYRTLTEHRHTLEAEEDALYADQRRLGRRQALGSALVSLGVGLSAVLALWLAAEAHIGERLSGPLTVMMPLAVLALNEALASLPMAFTQLGATRAAARRLNELAALRGAIGESESPEEIAESGALSASLDDVSLHYLKGHADSLPPALDNVSLTLAPGERLALVGASGAGKSSVAQLLVRLIEPTTGKVSVGGQDVRQLSPVALRGRIGYLTQQVELFHDSLATNLRLANPEASDAELWNALELVELEGWAQALPQGLETWVGESGRQLSGGQARRVALARVLLTDADLLILDEPFAGLDEATATSIAARLDGWFGERSVLYLAHDDTGLPGVNRTLRLHEGRLG